MLSNYRVPASHQAVMMKVSLKIVFARTAAQVSDVVHAMRHCFPCHPNLIKSTLFSTSPFFAFQFRSSYINLKKKIKVLSHPYFLGKDVFSR